MRTRPILLTLALGLVAALGATAPAAAVVPYPGIKLNPPGKTYHHSHSGPVFIRIYCPGEVFGEPRGFCTGEMKLFHEGRLVGRAPVASGDYDGPSMEVPLSRSFRAAVRRAGRPLPVDVVITSHDLQGLEKTTRGRVFIASPPEGRDAPESPAPPLPRIALREPPRRPQVPHPGSYAGVPQYVTHWGNPGNVFSSDRPGWFGGGRQKVGGDRPHENPAAVAVDEAGHVYVADQSNNRIQVFDPRGGFVRSFGAFGLDPGSARRVAAFDRFNNPVNLVVAGGRAFIVDQRNDRIMAWKVGAADRPLVRIGRRGALPGRFVAPWDVALTANGELLVLDQANYRVQRFSRTGRLLGSFGRFGTDRGGFQMAWSVAVHPGGRIFIADQMRNRILVFSPSYRFLTEFGRSGMDPGELNRPQGIAFDKEGRLLVANTRNRRIDRYSVDGEFLDSFGYGPDDLPSERIVDTPADIAVDPRDGSIYVADAGNQHPSGRCGRFGIPDPDPCRGRRIIKFADPAASPVDGVTPSSVAHQGLGSGRVTLTLDPEAARVLRHVKVAMRGAAGASGGGRAVSFPLTDAVVDFGAPPTFSSLATRGAAVLSGPDGRATLSAPVVTWGPRGPSVRFGSPGMFYADLSGLGLGGAAGRQALAHGIGLRLTAAGAATLNRALGIDVFSRAYRLGELSVVANAAPAPAPTRRG